MDKLIKQLKDRIEHDIKGEGQPTQIALVIYMLAVKGSENVEPSDVIKTYLTIQENVKASKRKAACPQNTVRTTFGSGSGAKLVSALVNFGQTGEVMGAVETELAKVDIDDEGKMVKVKGAMSWPMTTQIDLAAKAARARLTEEASVHPDATSILEDDDTPVVGRIIKPLDLDGALDDVASFRDRVNEFNSELRTLVALGDRAIRMAEDRALPEPVKFTFTGGHQTTKDKDDNVTTKYYEVSASVRTN
jgi:hypothetical protein